MKYSLNVYGKDSEIEKTVGTNFVPTGLFIKALKMSEDIKEDGKTELEAFDVITEIVLTLFPDLTKEELMNKCDIGDVISIFKQITVRANQIMTSKN